MGDEQLRQNKAIRGAYRGHLTKDLKKAAQIMVEDPADPGELIALQDRLLRRCAEVAELDNAIVKAFSSPTDIEQEVEDALCWSDKVSDCQSAMRRFLAERSYVKPVSPFHSSNVSNEKGPSPHTRAAVRLPKLELKTFSGDKLEWLTFWDGFSSAVDSNTELSNVDKMNYLCGLLKGNAARVIAGLPLSDGNYLTAVQLLKERFGKKQALINAYMDALSKITPTTSDVRRLRSFYDSCENHIRGLEALGTKTDTYGNLLLPIIIKKLPEEIRCVLFRTNPLADSSLDELRSSLLHEIETREKSHTPSMSDLFEALPSTSGVSPPPTAGALVSKTQTKVTRYKSKARNCVYCDGPHRPERCDKLVTVEDRLGALRRHKRCFNCLAENHTTRQCYSKGRCLKCANKHHTSLCKSSKGEEGQYPPTNTRETTDASKPKPDPTPVGTTQVVSPKAKTILSQTAIATVVGENSNCLGCLLFDTGSQRTFITKQLRDKLQLRTIAKELLEVATFESPKNRSREYEVVTFKLVTNQRTSIDLTALVASTICPAMKIESIAHPRLAGMRLANPPKASAKHHVDILIGNDHYGELITGEIIKCDSAGLIAMNSKFGWLLSGPVSKENHNQGITSCCRVDSSFAEYDDLDILLPRFWESNDIETTPEDADEEIHDQFKDTIRFNNTTNRYSVRLPWKHNKHDLPNNFGVTKRRLNGLRVSLMKRDPTLMKQYNQYIEDQVSQGFIEKVPEREIHEGILHYIPHFPVFKSDSATTKMRVVYDASAKSSPNALSLNDCLYKGPNLMKELLDILLRFRIHRIAFTADIEKAFLQIELNEEDRDATRFLWFKDLNLPTHNENIEVYRFCRVLFGAAPSPFLLSATVGYHLDKKKGSKIAVDLKESMYMDNVVTGAESEAQAMKYYALSREFLKEAGMNLRQWTTNSVQLAQKASEDKVNAARSVKVLGLVWDSENDTLSLSLDRLTSAIEANNSFTKRRMLSLASMLFDPLGLTDPVTIRAKIMMQELWKLNTSWDENLPDEYKEQWIHWLDEVKDLTFVRIARHYVPTLDVRACDLHVFCDSSKLAYGAVAYFKCGNSTAWIMAKSKVAPLKTQTLPRLELQAAVLGAKVAEHIRKAFDDRLQICQTHLWTDSQIVLAWLTSNKRLQQFVGTRVRRIKEVTSNDTWRYCPTSDNPADLLTRGIPAKCLAQKFQTWLQGPEWLKEPESAWPSAIGEPEIAESHPTQIAIASARECRNILNILDLKRYSTLDRTIRVAAYVGRFIERCKKHHNKHTILCAEELLSAETRLISAAQQDAYPSVKQHLSRSTVIKKTPSIVNQLGLFLDATFQVVSDNATNFKATSAILEEDTKQILEADKSQQYFAGHGITWQFIAERAPWWGGFYERLVGLTKRCLKKTIGKACLGLIELNTVLTEVEAVLNSRPLTYTYSDIGDGTPLTPSHFLCGHRLLTIPRALPREQDSDPDFMPENSTKSGLSKRMRHHEKLMERFWQQWRKEYLTGLREFHQFKKSKLQQAGINEGDVVLIHDDSPRARWKIAIVVEVISGQDGRVRSARVRTSNGNILARPIEKLYPLEVREENEKETEQPKKETEQPIDPTRPPKRKAAREADEKLKELLKNS